MATTLWRNQVISIINHGSREKAFGFQFSCEKGNVLYEDEYFSLAKDPWWDGNLFLFFLISNKSLNLYDYYN